MASERASNLPTLLLAVECSQRTGSVALLGADGTVESTDFVSGGREEDPLLPAIDRLLERGGFVPGDLTAIAVSTGPGGFTGLRVAIATVKGIAEITGARVLAVPGAEVAAEGIRARLSTGDRVLVASAAKRETCWLTPLECAEDAWQTLPGAGLHVIDPPSPAAVELARDAIVLADEHVPAPGRSGLAEVAADLLEPRLDAVSCARVALGMFDRGVSEDPLALAPIYPREPEAVRSWRERNR